MGTSLRHPPEPKFLPPHMETELLVFDVPVLLQSVLIFHNIVPVCFSLIFSILFLSSSDYGILCSLLWVGIGKKLSLSDHTHSFKSFYLQGPLRRYPAIYYEIQRYLLKKIQDTRNIVHRTMTLSPLQSRHIGISHSSPSCHQLPCCIFLNLISSLKSLPFLR